VELAGIADERGNVHGALQRGVGGEVGVRTDAREHQPRERGDIGPLPARDVVRFPRGPQFRQHQVGARDIGGVEEIAHRRRVPDRQRVGARGARRLRPGDERREEEVRTTVLGFIKPLLVLAFAAVTVLPQMVGVLSSF